MKTRIENQFQYEGLGFPIVLENVEMVYFKQFKEWMPKIDVMAVADKAIKELLHREERFTGNQVRFIRKHFDMSLREFGAAVKESQSAVAKWEKCNNQVTHMDLNIENTIRLFIAEHLYPTKSKQSNEFLKCFKWFKGMSSSDKRVSHLVIPSVA